MQINAMWEVMFTGSETQQQAQQHYRTRMGELIKHKRLLDGLNPTCSIGCHRITLGDPYMEAIQKPNVDVHFTPVTKITEDGVIGADGIERKVDTIVCATGFARASPSSASKTSTSRPNEKPRRNPTSA
ncbi:MAG: flavin-binding monooxygenase [Lasallia pustulata]|uniref:Flavin-binding monooxygenase n=1 Tax=Lasallia pustulata TaxID=136370 RepID=A0A5M8PI63_9LECA|nr:MAG: flavin-binding monooxygenase [Lasallia pustulata]